MNPRPHGPEPCAIPNFATPRDIMLCYYTTQKEKVKQKNVGSKFAFAASEASWIVLPIVDRKRKYDKVTIEK